MNTTLNNIVGVVLAGGQGRRMNTDGGDKPLMRLGDKTMLAHVIERAAPQCGQMIINANGDASRFGEFNLPVVADSVPDFAGPLAGVLAALDWAATNAPGCRFVASFAGDAPFLPVDLVARLAAAVAEGGADMARAVSFGRRHPVFGLWPLGIRAELRHRLVNDDCRKIDLFTADYDIREVEFDGIPDPFFNVNTPDDRAEAVRILKAG